MVAEVYGPGGAVDVSDRPGRLLGEVTGAAGAGLSTEATLAAVLARAALLGTDAQAAAAVAALTALRGQLPAALAGNGGLAVEDVATGYKEPAGNPFTLGNGGTTGTIDTATLGRWVSLHVRSNPSANTVTWECSHDGVNWVGWSLSSVTSTVRAFNSTTNNGIAAGWVPTRYVRVRVSNFIGGTVVVSLQFHPMPTPDAVVTVDTELGLPAALADSRSNPTEPSVGADLSIYSGTLGQWVRARDAAGADGGSGAGDLAVGPLVYNGATWDRLRGSAANGVVVDVAREPAALEVTGTGTIVGDTPIASTDVGRYRSFSVQIVAGFTGTVVFEQSNNGTTWAAAAVINVVNNGAGQASAVAIINPAAGSLYAGFLYGRFFRARVSAATSGTVSLIAEFTATTFNWQQGTAVDTELSTPQALADAASNPTIPGVGAFGMVWDGVGGVWNRQQAARNLADGIVGGGINAAALAAYNGATFDRLRTGPTLGSLLAALAPSSYQTPAGGPTFTLGALGTFFTVDTSTMGRWMSVQMVANASGNTVTWEGSNDGGTTWRAFLLGEVLSGGSAALQTSTTATAGAWAGMVPFQQVRVRLSNFVGGTTTVAVQFHATPASPNTVSVDTELPGAAALADATANPTVPAVGSFGMVWDSIAANWSRSASAKSAAQSGVNALATSTLAVSAISGSTPTFDTLRTPSKFVTATATAAGDTALWTPGAGRKFRLMGYKVEITGDVTQAVAGVVTVTLRDNVTGTPFTESFYVPAAAINSLGHFATAWVSLGNGYVSAAANNVLNINLSAALATGTCRVLAIGIEE